MIRRITEYVLRHPYEGDGQDEMGDEIATYGPPEPVGIYEFAPGGSVEPLIAGQDRVITTPTIYMPYDCPFVPFDRCEIGRDMYEVEGHPGRWKHRRVGREVGSVVNLKLVEG